jgi:hypothetical protein
LAKDLANLNKAPERYHACAARNSALEG